MLAGLHRLQLGSLLLQCVHSNICCVHVTWTATPAVRRAGKGCDWKQMQAVLLPCHSSWRARLGRFILKRAAYMVDFLLNNLKPYRAAD